ncbi:MAG TPA: hypothetical protein VGK67_32195 [Myxococcales bacterium]
MAQAITGGGRAGWRWARVAVWATVWVWGWGWAGTARASDEKVLSPRQALSALPRPPSKADEARSRWSGGVDRAVQPIRQGAQIQLAAAQRELGGQRAFDRDPEQRRAAAARLDPGEVTALLALEQAHTAQPVELSRNIEKLARSERQEIEEKVRAVDEARKAALAACQDKACERAAEREAKKARAELLSRLLEQTTARWELLKMRLDYFLAERLRLAERVATATSDPYVMLQAQGLLADAWRTVAELADEVEKETALAARLAE